MAESGELWIKVIEGKDLEAKDSNGKSDPFVEINIMKQKHKTKVRKETLNPVWNEEFVFTFSTRPASVELQCFDWNLIGSNDKIGKVDWPLQTLAPGLVIDAWLPLTKAKSGQIHVQAVWTPKRIDKLSDPARLPSFRLIMERNSYFPGETIRGMVVLNVGKPRKVRGVRLRFQGYSRTHWSVSHGTGKHRHTVHYYAYENHYHTIATLWGNKRGSSDSMMMPSGGYVWPFEFTLPYQLPPTHGALGMSSGSITWSAATYGNTVYSVNPYIDIPWAMDKQIYQPIRVVLHVDNIPRILSGASPQTQGIIHGGLPIFVQATLPEILFLNEPIAIPLTIKNDSDKAVKEASIDLWAYGTYFARRSGVGAMHVRMTRYSTISFNVKGTGFPIAPKSSWSGSVQILLPETVPNTSPETLSRIIRLAHKLKVRAITEGNVFTKAKSTAKFPVVVGARILNAQPPAQPPVSVGQVRIATVQPQAVSVPVVYSHGTSAYVATQPIPNQAFAQFGQTEQWQEAPKDAVGLVQPNEQVQFEAYDKAADRASQQEHPPDVSQLHISDPRYQQPQPGQPGAPGSPGASPAQPAPGM